MVEITIFNFLSILETEQRIQSAEAVFDRAVTAGRRPFRAGKFADHDPSIRDAVHHTLATARPPPKDRP